MPIKLVCGLGNPADVAPEESLHNLGFMAVDAHAQAHSLAQASFPQWDRERDCLVCRVGDVRLVKPLYVDINHSGVPIRELMELGGVKPAEVVIVHDDIDLPSGKVKLKSGPSSDRHNGVRSVASELGSQDFIRLKGGVGRPPDRGVSVLDWVKGKMDPSMRPVVDTLISKLSAAISILRSSDLSSAREKISRI